MLGSYLTQVLHDVSLRSSRNIVAREAMAAEPPILVFRQAGFQSGSFPFSSRLRRPYSLSAVKILPRTRTIPPATQASMMLDLLLDFQGKKGQNCGQI